MTQQMTQQTHDERDERDIWSRDPQTDSAVRALHDDAVRASVIARLETSETTVAALEQRAREANGAANALRGDIASARERLDTARRATWKSKTLYWRDIDAAQRELSVAEDALVSHERVQRVYWARVRVGRAWIAAYRETARTEQTEETHA